MLLQWRFSMSDENLYEGDGELDTVNGSSALQSRPKRPAVLAQQWQRYYSEHSLFITSSDEMENDCKSVSTQHDQGLVDAGVPALYPPWLHLGMTCIFP